VPLAVELVAAGEVGGFLIPRPEPRELVLGAVGLRAAVLVPLDARRGPQDARLLGLRTERAGGHKRPDVKPDAVVDVGIPADGLLGERLPADEDVERRLALDDLRELLLEVDSGGHAGVGAFFARPPAAPSVE
jgi:hypothetical protein